MRVEAAADDSAAVEKDHTGIDVVRYRMAFHYDCCASDKAVGVSVPPHAELHGAGVSCRCDQLAAHADVEERSYVVQNERVGVEIQNAAVIEELRQQQPRHGHRRPIFMEPPVDGDHPVLDGDVLEGRAGIRILDAPEQFQRAAAQPVAHDMDGDVPGGVLEQRQDRYQRRLHEVIVRRPHHPHRRRLFAFDRRSGARVEASRFGCC